jgi:hypothetical protein
MTRHTLEFRALGRAVLLAEAGDELVVGERILASLQVTVLQLSVLFNDDDARRDALVLFALAHEGHPDTPPIEVVDLHPVVQQLRLMIIGAAMASAALGPK